MPEIQVFPMSDDYLSHGQSIGDFFTRDIAVTSAHRPVPGRFNFKKQGVTAPAGSLLLFQYDGKLVAHAVLLARHPADRASAADSNGFFLLDLETLRYYRRPIAASELHYLWPNLSFNQGKHKLDTSQRQAFMHFTARR
jgi:hypothetical protein